MKESEKPPTEARTSIGKPGEERHADDSKDGERAQGEPDDEVLARGPFRRVDPFSWRDPRIRGLTDSGHTLLDYIEGGPLSTGEGLYVLPVVMMASDLDRTIKWARGTLEELKRVDLVRYDESMYTVLAMNKLPLEMPWSRKAIKGACGRLERLHYTPLFEVFAELIIRFSEAAGARKFALEFRDAMLKVIERKRGHPISRSDQLIRSTVPINLSDQPRSRSRSRDRSLDREDKDKMLVTRQAGIRGTSVEPPKSKVEEKKSEGSAALEVNASGDGDDLEKVAAVDFFEGLPEEWQPVFDRLWGLYPRQVPEEKTEAEQVWQALIVRGVLPATIQRRLAHDLRTSDLGKDPLAKWLRAWR